MRRRAYSYCSHSHLQKDCSFGTCARGREMSKQGAGFDFHRYRQLLAEAVDEPKRLAFIELLVEERAKEQLDNAQRAVTIASVLGTSRA
jgi:hypothetical protein